MSQTLCSLGASVAVGSEGPPGKDGRAFTWFALPHRQSRSPHSVSMWLVTTHTDCQASGSLTYVDFERRVREASCICGMLIVDIGVAV